jgi:glycosyltransferase involved in cell wall biosynthesis
MESISIITPVLRPEASYLEELAASIAAQSLGVTEWVVVSQGDHQGITEMILVASTLAYRHIALAAPIGAAAARNMALAATRSRWICPVDADDWLPAESIKTQVASLACHPDARWCIGAGTTVDADGSTEEWPNHLLGFLRRGALTKDMARSDAMPSIPVAGLFDREAVVSVGGWPALPVSEDLLLKLRLSASYPGVGVPSSTYFYRRSVQGQLTSRADYALMNDLSRTFIEQVPLM